MPAAVAVGAYLTIMADSTMDVFDSHAQGRLDDETAQWRLDVNAEDITNMMLGLNPPIDD
jgi:hypothetical protein